MKKGLVIGIIIILIIVLGIGSYFLFFKTDISKIGTDKLYSYTLEQEEVIKFIGGDEILSGHASPKSVFTQEIYDSIKNVEPSCLDNLKIGDETQVVVFYTETHEIDIIWSLRKNKIVCILGVPND